MASVNRGARLLRLPVDEYREKLRQQIQNNSCVDAASGCWEWSGYKWRNGYGQTRMYGAITPAHRASHFAFTGADSTGLDVCHSCDNRACVNPKHLFTASHLENMHDMIKKGRRIQGRANPRRGSDNKQSIPVRVSGRTYSSRGEAARALGVSKKSIQNWIRSGIATSTRQGINNVQRP